MRTLPVLFFLSGATSLVYETVFAKELGHVFGVTAYAATTVVASFMGGLALGAFWLGRVADAPPAWVRSPLRLYAILELGIGLYAVAVPLLIGALEPAYVALYRATGGGLGPVTAIRVVLGGIVVAVPTVLMGGTLPAVVRVARGSAPRLYAWNTIGAAVGVLAGTYLLLPRLGIRGTLAATCVVNVLLFLVALRVDSGARDPEPRADPAPALPAPRAVLVAAFASGLVVLAYEVLWTHLLAVVIGNSVYAFGIMLVTFLAALAAGSALASRLATARDRAVRLLVGSQVAAGVVALAVLPLWDDLPLAFTILPAHAQTFARVETIRFAAAAALLGLPTTLMGLAFPLALQLAAGDVAEGRAVGRAVFWNTAGGIAGSLASGFVLLPALGSHALAVALALALVAIACALSFAVPPRSPRFAVPGAAVAIALAALLPGWDWLALTNGANVYGYPQNESQRLVFVDEDVRGGVTTVTRNRRETTLWTNGKFQGNDGAEMPAQERMGHLLMLFAKPRARVLVIGLGTGTTLGTVLRYDVARADVAEIAPGITRAARTHFARANDRALEDPRVRLHDADGRNFLLLEERTWDAIQAEISSIWFAGAADLFNVEFFRQARRRLAPGGVIEVWIQLHHIEPESLMMAIGAMRDAFPHTSLWLAEYQGLLFGSDRPLSADWARVRANEARPEVRETLRRVPLESLYTLLGQQIVGPDAPMRYRRLLRRAGLPRFSTDDNLRLEFDTPRGNVLGWNLDANVRILRSFSRLGPPPIEGAPSEAEAALVLGYARFGAHRPTEAVRRFEDVVTRWPDSDAARRATDALERIRARRTVWK